MTRGTAKWGAVTRKLNQIIRSMQGSGVVTEREFANLAVLLREQLPDDSDKEVVYAALMMDVYYRKLLVSDYYKIPLSVIDGLLNEPPDRRRALCAEAGVNGYIFRTLFDYSRYPDCFCVFSTLGAGVAFRGANVLDFGCMVSDYGFFFGMLGAHVTLCDVPEHADFAEFRLRRAGIACDKVYAPADYNLLTQGKDMAFFGEVLEHLEDPLLLLQCCVQNGVQGIYSSCYPYGDDAYFNRTGHTREAQAQAPESIKLLRKHYQEICFENNRRLWVAR